MPTPEISSPKHIEPQIVVKTQEFTPKTKTRKQILQELSQEPPPISPLEPVSNCENVPKQESTTTAIPDLNPPNTNVPIQDSTPTNDSALKSKSIPNSDKRAESTRNPETYRKFHQVLHVIRFARLAQKQENGNGTAPPQKIVEPNYSNRWGQVRFFHLVLKKVLLKQTVIYTLY